MKNERLLNVIGEIDEKHIVEAAPTKKKTTKPVWVKWTAIAACLCLVFVGTLGARNYFIHLQEKTPELDSAEESERNDKAETVVSTGEDKEFLVYTDRVALPESFDGVECEMIGCLVYKGSVYTSASCYDDVSSVKHLVGDYIGEAKGTLDEWSSQEDWTTEFASTYSGPVYTVKGYSEDFRLCIYVKSGGTEWLQFLDNFDGIGLNTGNDLFEDRFHIKNNVAQVTYLTHDDWDNNKPSEHNYQKLKLVTNEQFDEFIDILCDSPFERIVYSENNNFYNTAVQGHLYLNLKDGTQIELRLVEGGYVGCQELGWVFVKMPGEIFDSVLSACQ